MAVTTAAVVGIASGGFQAVQGFTSAANAKSAAQDAENEATRMMNEARKRAEVNEYEKLNIPLDAYEAKFENNLAADKQAIEALQEGDSRALAAGATRVGAQQNVEAEQTRIDMADEMFNLDKMKTDAREQQKQQLIAMDVGEAKMQDQRAREQQQIRADSITSGIQGVTQIADSAASLAPLYGKNTADRRASKMIDDPAMRMKAELAGVNLNDEGALLDFLSEQGMTGRQVRNRNQGLTNESMFDLLEGNYMSQFDRRRRR
jgi:hypothetical protein